MLEEQAASSNVWCTASGDKTAYVNNSDRSQTSTKGLLWQMPQLCSCAHMHGSHNACRREGQKENNQAFSHRCTHEHKYMLALGLFRFASLMTTHSDTFVSNVTQPHIPMLDGISMDALSNNLLLYGIIHKGKVQVPHNRALGLRGQRRPAEVDVLENASVVLRFPAEPLHLEHHPPCIPHQAVLLDVLLQKHGALSSE